MLNNKFSFPVFRSLHAVLYAQVPTSPDGRYDPHVLALTPFLYLRDLVPSVFLFVYRVAYLASSDKTCCSGVQPVFVALAGFLLYHVLSEYLFPMSRSLLVVRLFPGVNLSCWEV